MPIRNRFAETHADITAWRRHLHTIPELQFDLPQTTAFVEEKLREFYNEWEDNFAELNRESFQKIEALKQLHEEQMELLNQKLDRAVEAVKVKPVAKLKELQCQEKLVAINERIEEAMNYRKELRDLEVEEAKRVEKVRNDNADKQRRKLLADQKKEMLQLEQKIETARYNLKIRMDKELNTLQKEINLHVNDIKRIQGLISRLNVTKGKTQDELRRTKDRARKTMNQLNNHKKVETAAEKTLKGGGGATMAAGATIAGVTGSGDAGGLLLFSNMKKKDLGNMMTSSLGNTLNSNSTYMNNILPLKYLLKAS